MKKPIPVSPALTTWFYEDQIDTWPMLDANTEILDEALQNEKEIYFGDCFWIAEKYLLQYRKGSLTADVDKALSGERPCFLCPPARPAEQKTLGWEGYDILVNPYPVAFPHFTIVDRTHSPQLIKGRIKDMARMTRLFEECCVIYNGPRCGASAPDHMHFQALDFNLMRNIFIALENDLTDEIGRLGKSRVFIPRTNAMAAPYIGLDIAADKDLEQLFSIIYGLLPAGDPEPMMNIAAVKKNSRTILAIFPRRRHRPANYGDGAGQILISPATLEMLGTFPVSRDKELRYLGEKRIMKIYDEVCISADDLVQIATQIKDAL